jgi:Lon-like protease
VTGDAQEKHSRVRFLLAAVIGLGAALFLFYVPLPVLVFGPGDAVDLNGLVVVPHRTPPPGTLYLTDVKVMPGRPAFYIAGKVLPGFEIVPRQEYAGNTSDTQFDRELADAMTESQQIAQVVAERAAGLPVKTETKTKVVEIKAGMPAERCFKTGDVIAAIDGLAPSGPESVARAAQSKPVGTTFRIAVVRDGCHIEVACHTARFKDRRLFGVIVSANTRIVSLPVKVEYNVKDINGSSAGLMFALQIYRTLTGKPLAGGKKIAGTGVLTADGSVLPVGGAIEKVRAAIAQGASIFLVPQMDYPAISSVRGITIIPVRSFDGALRRLARL